MPRAKRRGSKPLKKTKGQADYIETWSIITIAIGFIFGVIIYSNAAGDIGNMIKVLLFSIFGAPSYVLPVMLAGSGIYLLIVRDYDKFYIKLSLLFIALINLCAIWQVFVYYPATEMTPSEYFITGVNGGGLFGALAANYLIDWIGNIITAIIYFASILILSSLIFKISFIRVLFGIFKTAKKEASQINAEKSFEVGRKIRSGVENSLKPLKNSGIDIEINNKKSSPPKCSADLDIPVFDSIAKRLNQQEAPEEEIITPSELFSDNSLTKTVDNEKLSAKEEKQLKDQLEQSVQAQLLPYKFPPITLLSPAKIKKNSDARDELRQTAVKLVDTLKSFGVDVNLLQVSRGPTVTRYELQPSVGVKVSKITSLSDDIALNLAAPAVRIEAPIPGKAAIGIEVPNLQVSSVAIRDVIESTEFKNSISPLSIALGMDITGKPIIADIAKMPHVLIAGATGSGKSVCINSLITSILYKADPNEVKLAMIDPKVVELSIYKDIPHLITQVVTDPKKASGLLNWAVSEMTRRYKLFADNNVRDIKGYNELADMSDFEKLPNIVLIIDELADLMMVSPSEVEDSICRLAQMARAAGMHLVIATQRPSVDVITGIIKANIPTRIAFAVSSHIDSRTILDMSGAEKLLGKGDMLYYPSGASKPLRLQGSYISDKEVEKVVSFVKKTSRPGYDEDVSEQIKSEGTKSGGDCDELLHQAITIAVDMGQISTSMLQRKLGVGYARAGRIVDQMQERGIISGANGSKPRNVLISPEEFENMCERGSI